MNKQTVSIGVTAYNEQRNLAQLIVGLLQQKLVHLELGKIMVISDGSTDETVANTECIHDPRVIVIDGKERKGKAARMNELLEGLNSDFIILFDADVVVTDEYLVEKLVRPIREGKADLTSGRIIELPGRSSVEEVLSVSMKIKHRLFANLKEGNNLYSCHGPLRAFSKRFAQKLRFEESDGEDMYSYLACIANGFSFAYVPEAYVFYRLPNVLRDHMQQSVRYHDAKKLMTTFFDPILVKKEIEIPFFAYVYTGVLAFPYILSQWDKIIRYVVLYIRVRFAQRTQRAPNTKTWDAVSTKVM